MTWGRRRKVSRPGKGTGQGSSSRGRTWGICPSQSSLIFVAFCAPRAIATAKRLCDRLLSSGDTVAFTTVHGHSRRRIAVSSEQCPQG